MSDNVDDLKLQLRVAEEEKQKLIKEKAEVENEKLDYKIRVQQLDQELATYKKAYSEVAQRFNNLLTIYQALFDINLNHGITSSKNSEDK